MEVGKLYGKICILTNVPVEIKAKLAQLESEMATLVSQLDPLTTLMMKHKTIVREISYSGREERVQEDRIKMTLLELKSMLTPHVDIMQTYVKKSEELISTLEMSIVGNMEELVVGLVTNLAYT